MHAIEPHFSWRNEYVASEDYKSPFFEREYSEFEYTNRVYNFLLHPQWDDFGSDTLFIKILFADYDSGAAIIELIGEWNDCIENDIMNLKLEVLEILMGEGIDKFILIGENVLNFHSSDDLYYEEWLDELEDGWIVFLNFHPHVLDEMEEANIDNFVLCGEDFEMDNWRTYKPSQLVKKIAAKVENRFNLPLLD